MACKRKIYGDNSFRNKALENRMVHRESQYVRAITVENFHNGFCNNGRTDITNKTDILSTCEHKTKFSKIRSYFMNLSTKISPVKIGTTIRNSKLLSSKSCDNLLCTGGSRDSLHAEPWSDTDSTRNNGSWLLKSKFNKLKSSRYWRKHFDAFSFCGKDWLEGSCISGWRGLFYLTLVCWPFLRLSLKNFLTKFFFFSRWLRRRWMSFITAFVVSLNELFLWKSTFCLQ